MNKVRVVLRNPLNHKDQIDYNIIPADNELAVDWVNALKGILHRGNLLEKNFCFMGFPKTSRTLEYLCSELTEHVNTINQFFPDYQITETYSVDTITITRPSRLVEGVMVIDPNHDILNQLHNHFERLQGTVWNLSDYYRRADYETKYAIRQLNNICHEIENLILSKRKHVTSPFWIRPSQITTFLNVSRYDLKPQHREGFVQNGYDRVLGGVYMHWTQIGKTLMEVYRDEGAPELTDTVCEAINELQYYSGEFDIEWANDVVYSDRMPWHKQQVDGFHAWLIKNGRDPADPNLSLGYLPIGQVDLQASFGGTDSDTVWDALSGHLDIYRIEVHGVSNTFDYCWTDSTYKQMQIDMMKPGYDYSSRG